jgi:hypothetical protein
VTDSDDIAATPDQGGRTLIVVAGSGRSGTSLCSTLLHRLGYYIPQPEVQANRNNPRGYGEPRWAVDFHQRWLDERDVSKEDARPRAIARMERLAARPKPARELKAWLAEQFDIADRIVVKDPRLTWFTGLYRDAAESLGARFGVVTMLRHPVETTRSRETAYGSSLSDISRMSAWVNMMLAVELATRSMPRALIRYDDLVADWRGALAAADDLVGPGLVAGASAEQLATAEDLVDPGLRRSAATWDEYDVPDELQRLAQSSHDALDKLAATPAGDADDPSPEQALDALKSLDAARAAYGVYYGYCEQVARTSAVAVRRDQKRKDAEVIRGLEGELKQARRALDVAAAQGEPAPSQPASTTARSLSERVRGRLRRRRAGA